MAINDLILPYPDFVMGEVIDPEEFDANNGEVVAKINEIIALLGSFVSGDIDTNIQAGSISISAIEPFTERDVQSLLVSLITRLRSVEDAKSGADFLGTTAIEGVEGVTVQAVLEDLAAIAKGAKEASDGLVEALAAHKGSTDHDERYYQKSEVDAKVSGFQEAGADADFAGTWQGFSPSDFLASDGTPIDPDNPGGGDTGGGDTGGGQYGGTVSPDVLVIPVLQADPATPVTGQIWIRGDL